MTNSTIEQLNELMENYQFAAMRPLLNEMNQINLAEFLKYPESSAGSVMTAEFVSFSKSLTVSQVFEYIRNTGIDKETVYLCYVTNQSRILEGVVSFKELLFAASGIY